MWSFEQMTSSLARCFQALEKIPLNTNWFSWVFFFLNFKSRSLNSSTAKLFCSNYMFSWLELISYLDDQQNSFKVSLDILVKWPLVFLSWWAYLKMETEICRGARSDCNKTIDKLIALNQWLLNSGSDMELLCRVSDSRRMPTLDWPNFPLMMDGCSLCLSLLSCKMGLLTSEGNFGD